MWSVLLVRWRACHNLFFVSYCHWSYLKLYSWRVLILQVCLLWFVATQSWLQEIGSLQQMSWAQNCPAAQPLQDLASLMQWQLTCHVSSSLCSAQLAMSTHLLPHHFGLKVPSELPSPRSRAALHIRNNSNGNNHQRGTQWCACSTCPEWLVGPLSINLDAESKEGFEQDT